MWTFLIHAAAAGAADTHSEDIRALFDNGRSCAHAARVLEGFLGWEGCAVPPGSSAAQLPLWACLQHLDDHCEESSAILSSAADEAWFGESGGDWTGWASVVIGDTDGDGLDEFAVTSLYEASVANDAGAAYLVSSSGQRGNSLADAQAKFRGTAYHDYLGWSVCGVGDMTGDGLDDLVTGAPETTVSGLETGAAYLFDGTSTGSVGAGDATATILGLTESESMGSSCAGLEDFDGDSVRDLLVGDEHYDSVSRGGAYVFSGPLTGTLYASDATLTIAGATDDGRAGSAVATADLDGDGSQDLVIAADTEATYGEDSGAVYFLYGPTSGTISLSDAYAALYGSAASNRFGWQVATGGDADGDGLDDVLTKNGASEAIGSQAGTVYLMSGLLTGAAEAAPVAMASLDWPTDADNGNSVDWLGDVDGDGIDDIVAGGKNPAGAPSYAGGAAIMLGPLTGSVSLDDAWRTLRGEKANDYFGYAVAGGGDFDGDGTPDLAVTSRGDSFAAEWAGALYLFSGAGL